MNRPFFTVFAGCNGSGKSTFSFEILKSIDENTNVAPFDFDGTKKEIYDSMPDSELRDRMAHNKTVIKFEALIEQSIKSHNNFSYETNYNASPLFWPKKFKGNGFETNLVFFCLSTLQLAYERVELRVFKGGHFVSKEEIKSRFIAGYKNLDETYRFYDNVYLIDSSRNFDVPKPILSIHKKEVIIFQERLPSFLSERLPKMYAEIQRKQDGLNRVDGPTRN